MVLNGEELMEHEKFKANQYSRPTEEQQRIAYLETELNHAQNTINYLNNHIDGQESKKRITYSADELDKIFEQRNQVESECRKLQLDQQNIVEFSEQVLRIMGWIL